MSQPIHRILIWVAVGGFAFLVGCTVAVNFGKGNAVTDSHDKDSHDSKGTNTRSWDLTIEPR